MKIANSFVCYSLNNIGKIDVEPALSAQDQRVPSRVALAEEISKRIKEGLAKELGMTTDATDKINPLILKVRTVRCTKGSRWGRVFCGEFGVGWALLFLEWYIMDATTGEVVFGAKTEKYRHHGSFFGVADICEPDVGEKAVYEMASMEGIPRIAMNVEAAFRNHGAREISW